MGSCLVFFLKALTAFLKVAVKWGEGAVATGALGSELEAGDSLMLSRGYYGADKSVLEWAHGHFPVNGFRACWIWKKMIDAPTINVIRVDTTLLTCITLLLSFHVSSIFRVSHAPVSSATPTTGSSSAAAAVVR